MGFLVIDALVRRKRQRVLNHWTAGTMGTSTSITQASGAQLAGMELFVNLSSEALADIAAGARVRSLDAGTTLFVQGAPATRCHAVLSGRIRIAQSGGEGGQLIVRFVGPGEMFGAMALFTDRRYPATAVAVTDAAEISWTEPELLALIHRYPQIALNLVRTAGARLREVQERLREVATQRVEQRIAHALLRLASHTSFREERTEIAFPLTRQDVADMCGATLYTASRVLTAWERAGYITTRRKHLNILDLDAIGRIADGAPDSQSRH